MTDKYCLFGNPVAHSKSPAIHAVFARHTGQDMSYVTTLAPLGEFAGCVQAFVAAGGRGANVTVPFKEQAFALVSRLTPRARLAGAVNTLVFSEGETLGDNTDGVGLVRDVLDNVGQPVRGARVLVLGAGGAARGVLGPLLDEKPASLVIANRSVDKASALQARFSRCGPVLATRFEDLAGQSFDIVINATSASLSGYALPLPDGLFAAGGLAYNMMYGQPESQFERVAREQGLTRVVDGLGMLVEQAAEAFFVWRGVRPDVRPVMDMLRAA